MSSGLIDASTFIINTLAQLYILVLLLRLLLPWLNGDFRNPLVQAILKLTSPVVVPVRRVVPPIGRVDTATLLIAFAVQYLAILVILLIKGFAATIAPIALTALIDLVMITIRLFVFAVLIRVILSWVAPGMHNPATAIIETLTQPVLRPLQRFLPAIGGLDLSPLFAMILLTALNIVIAPLRPIPI
ncbi:MAG: YggT family protein [Woeseiaceae bacterium]